MHITTVYESLPHVVMPPAELFDQPVQVTWTSLPATAVKPPKDTKSDKLETAGEIMARIGLWEGEPLTESPQGIAEERDPLL
jgi:hypothetical protein